MPANNTTRQFDNTTSRPGDLRRVSDVRRTREIGNWGRASEHVGRRWEELGFERLGLMLAHGDPWPTEGQSPAALVALMQDGPIQATLSRIGLPSPDVVVVLGCQEGELSLQALDFKWDLEFASYDQIRASALSALLFRDDGVLGQAIHSAARCAIAADRCVDGLLFAPDSPANQRFLTSHANLRQEFPIDLREVILVSVDPQDFFTPLPGWELAVRLAEFDRSKHSMQSLDGADHYYRLGAGLLGAAAQLQSSVFEPAPKSLDAAETIAFLKPDVRILSSASLLDLVERRMAVRSQLVARLRRLTKPPLSLGDLSKVLAARGIRLPDRPQSGAALPERERWMQVHRRTSVEYRSAILRAGLRLVCDGLSDPEALTRLEADSPRFASAARSLAERLIEQIDAR